MRAIYYSKEGFHRSFCPSPELRERRRRVVLRQNICPPLSPRCEDEKLVRGKESFMKIVVYCFYEKHRKNIFFPQD